MNKEINLKDHIGYQAALEQAKKSFSEAGVPIGASLVINEQVVASGHNERVQKGDPIAHGEMSALRRAGRRTDYKSMTLFTTLAPCDMCTGAILLFGIPRVVVGENKTFAGNLDYLRERGVEVVVLSDGEAEELMREFKSKYREVWNEDIGK